MYHLRRLLQLVFVALLFTLASCAPGANPSPYPNTSYPNISAASPTPRAIPTSPKYPTPLPPTPIQLPIIEGNVETEYCFNQPLKIYLPLSEAQGLTDDDIAEKLMSLYLDYYNNPQAPGYCRIDGYRIEKVYYAERLASPAYSPKGDFMRVVDFSIKLIQQPSQWIYSGEIDQQNWLHTSYVIVIFKFEADGVYMMRFPDP